MKTKYGFYKFMVMSFKLCNAPWTFTTLVNSIFHEKINVFMIIYIDDVLVYSKIVEEHVNHLKYVLNKLQKNQLFANMANNEFSQEEMDFMGISCHGKELDSTWRSWKPYEIGKGQLLLKEFDPS